MSIHDSQAVTQHLMKHTEEVHARILYLDTRPQLSDCRHKPSVDAAIAFFLTFMPLDKLIGGWGYKINFDVATRLLLLERSTHRRSNSSSAPSDVPASSARPSRVPSTDVTVG